MSGSFPALHQPLAQHDQTPTGKQEQECETKKNQINGHIEFQSIGAEKRKIIGDRLRRSWHNVLRRL
jgi:hypothetical protein